MCGFTGYLDSRIVCEKEQNFATLKNMADAIRLRGPDEAGVWSDESAGVGLAHRRLSIIDLSPAGRQPMDSASGRYVIAFNGEIYNHQALRARLEASGEAARWRGHSDTETLLAAIDAWGVTAALKMSVGMFAFALWDRRQRTVTLARDRLGEKPLYYGWQGVAPNACFLFGSELKALRAHPVFEGRIRRDALALYLRHNYIPAPYTIYEGIQKLPPASTLTLSLDRPDGEMLQYWSAADVATGASGERRSWEPSQAVDELDALLKSAVAQQMVADVPVGAFLSGGVDSSTVVALMQEQASEPVRTFSIGFGEPGYDEAVHAKAVARHLGTDHTELYVTAKQAMDVIPLLPTMYDEPFADSSQIPTYLVSALARQHVTVSLSGDGGDELFGGYSRYVAAHAVWNRLSAVPAPMRRLAARGITAISPQVWSNIFNALPCRRFKGMFGDKLHKGARVMSSDSIDALYIGLVSHWTDPAYLVIEGCEPATQLTGNAPDLRGLGAIERMMALDLVSYLPDDVLTKVDRAAMSVSLETRVPLLDHRVVEFAWSLPMSLKLRDGVGKWVLRQVLYRYVPQALLDRPKMGFGVPIDAWLRGPLRDWAEALIDASRLRREGFFRPDPIRQKWAEHLDGSRNWAYHLWDVLMFQAWLEAQSQ
jgi:asparagine synthase (glutamine-hydrolysing)